MPVFEIKGAELTLSPVHCCAEDEPGMDRGLSLRFPRFLRERPDKRPEDVTDAAALLEIFRAQPHEQAAENDESE